MGRCDEQVAVAFNQFLLSEQEINLEWFQAIIPNKPGGQNFLVLNRNLHFLGVKLHPMKSQKLGKKVGYSIQWIGGLIKLMR